MSGKPNLLGQIHRWRRLAAMLEEQLVRIPRQIKARQTHLANQEKAYQDEADAIKNLKVSIQDKEKSIQTMQGLVEKYSTQQQSSSSKKEFDAFTAEIKTTREKSAKLEEEILADMEEVERRTEELPELETARDAVRETLAQFEKESVIKKAELEAELKEANEKLAELEEQLAPEMRERYERVVGSKGHDGFAAVESRTCSGCSMQMTIQDHHELTIGHVVVCRSCERFLYLPE